jgi:hypothetical protein
MQIVSLYTILKSLLIFIELTIDKITEIDLQ